MLNVAEFIGSLEMQKYGTQYPAVPCIILEKMALKVTSLFLRDEGPIYCLASCDGKSLTFNAV